VALSAGLWQQILANQSILPEKEKRDAPQLCPQYHETVPRQAAGNPLQAIRYCHAPAQPPQCRPPYAPHPFYKLTFCLMMIPLRKKKEGKRKMIFKMSKSNLEKKKRKIEKRKNDSQKPP
jgi:hypothetical protein